MLKLTQRAWNNVLIISMLVLILLFNRTSNFLNGGSDNIVDNHLLPSDAQISTVDFGSYQVERIAKSWRCVGCSADIEQIEKLVTQWQTATTQASTENLALSDASVSQVVIISLLGQGQTHKYELFKVGDVTLVLYQQQVFQLQGSTFDDLRLAEPPHA
ncbi:MAG: hypothetical protein GW763_01595 [Paraglaciecola sp.]|nr:hypothetical protein [Paraglaciecola sp.]NCT46682.1 hypothetical protein [Paraglaciecola sp.]